MSDKTVKFPHSPIRELTWIEKAFNEAKASGEPFVEMLFKWAPYKVIRDRYGREFRVDKEGREVVGSFNDMTEEYHGIKNISGRYRVKDKTGRTFMIDESGNEIDGSVPAPSKVNSGS